MYRNEPLERYLNDAAAGTSTPGGGSMAALAGALATTMASMAANLTVGKEKFKQHDAQLKKVLEKCEKSRETLLSLMEEDIKAYGEVVNAYRLPKSTGEEKIKRSEAIQNAAIVAMGVPLKTMMCCLSVSERTRELVDIANPNLISEVGVACCLADAAFQSAKLNVETNLAAIRNQNLVSKVRNEINHAEKKAKLFFEETKERVIERMMI
ncbi:MAG: cyclodeaminase/cyclohydrolase family protein [Candidatus Brocadia sp.]|nr:cyclodeaminase/cyclohydrolase family protein [Candidatus Brocadia sp.]